MAASSGKPELFKALACFGFALVISLFPLTAFSQQTVSSLTEDNIRAFIARTSDVTNHKAADLADDGVKTYLETHLHPSARFKSKLTYEIPGFPSKETELALDKDEFIDSVRQGSQAVAEYSNEITVKEVKIAADGKNATVKTESTEEGMMNVEGQNVPIVGRSSCDQIIMLSDDRVIQMFNANCSTNIQFKDGF